jgi:very-short-patch-repair endonuclease
MPARMTSRARGTRRRQTAGEVRLWSRLRDRRLENLKFHRQVPRASYIADFLGDEAMLIIEVDGSQHAEQTADDERRTAYLENLGYLVLRFWNFENTDRVCDHIWRVAASRKKSCLSDLRESRSGAREA